MNSDMALKRITEICADLLPLAAPMDDEQLRQRAELIHKALRARSRMQTLRDRAVALNEALVRFQSRREAIARMAAA